MPHQRTAVIGAVLALAMLVACAARSAQSDPSPPAAASVPVVAVTPAAKPAACAFHTLTNAAPFGDCATFASGTSTWYQTVGAAPAQRANSTAIVRHMIVSIGTSHGLAASAVCADYAAVQPVCGFRHDFVTPYYASTAADPLVTVDCIAYACPPAHGGVQGRKIHIPANACPEPGGSSVPNCTAAAGNCTTSRQDCHLAVLDTTTSNGYGKPVECDFYQDNNRRPLAAGGTFTVGSASCLDPAVDTGWTGASYQGAAVAGGGAILPSIVTVDQTRAAISATTAFPLRHALAIAPACQTHAAPVFPANISAPAACRDANPNDTAPIGSLWWSDVPCSVVNRDPLAGTSLTLDPLSKVALCTLHAYGAYEVDTNANNFALFLPNLVESPMRYLSLGNRDVATAFYTSGNVLTNDGGGVFRPAIDSIPSAWLLAHLHVLAPCVAAKSC